MANGNVKVMDKEAAKRFLSNCSYEEVCELLNFFILTKGLATTNPVKYASAIALQQWMLENHKLKTCPHCGSEEFIRYGKEAGGLVCFKCKKCGRKFNVLTGTFLEKAHWSWELWVHVLQMTLNGISLENMVGALQKDYGCTGIDIKTVWQWRLKLLHALASMPEPTLTGVIQVDETYVRECQKGSKHLVSYLGNGSFRIPRYGYRPSLLGTMGPEFCTVVTAVDDRGYCICKVLGMGKITEQLFFDYFDEHIESPDYICSDSFSLYSRYCEKKGYKHYVRPSRYNKTLDDNGYHTALPFSGPLTEDEAKENHKILKALYSQRLIDYIEDDYCDYDQFNAVKKAAHLSLGRVNELHSDIKNYLYKKKTNVSSKYLQDYVSAFAYVRNWRVAHGHYPSSYTDAMEIFLELLCHRGNHYTKNTIRASKLVLPKPTGRFVAMLKKQTDSIRKEICVPVFKLDVEDGLCSFDRRAFLNALPRSALHKICHENGIRGYSKWPKRSIVAKVLTLPNINGIIANLIKEHRDRLVDEEDIKARAARLYVC